MKWLLTHRAWQDYQDAPASVQKAFDKQVGLLPENLRHPSLRAKKYDQANEAASLPSHLRTASTPALAGAPDLAP